MRYSVPQLTDCPNQGFCIFVKLEPINIQNILMVLYFSNWFFLYIEIKGDTIIQNNRIFMIFKKFLTCILRYRNEISDIPKKKPPPIADTLISPLTEFFLKGLIIKKIMDDVMLPISFRKKISASHMIWSNNHIYSLNSNLFLKWN